MTISRQLLGGNSSNQIGDDINQQKAKGQSPVLQKAVVTEVIYDPFDLTEDEKQLLSKVVNNPEFITVMPINSIIAQVVNNGIGQLPKQKTILFPLFSSHILLPIKVGEMVYVIYEDFSGTGTKLGYWFTRINSQLTVEDVNYTHHDRKFDPTHNPDNYKTQDKLQAKNNTTGPGFPNGGNTPDSFTLKIDDNSNQKKSDVFEQIKNNSKSFKLITLEPVPRFRKRPSDLVFQGSNNTLICLGEDRYNDVTNKDNKDYLGQSGTIDIVVGRGRKLLLDAQEPKQDETSSKNVLNSRGDLETDKAPYRKGFDKKGNINEGNPSLNKDAARIYISMQTNADDNFGIKLNSKNGNAITLPEVPKEFDKTNSLGKSFIINKSDHIRLISRKDSDEGIAGTLLLTREGDADNDLAYLYIDEKGQIQIESKKIYLGVSSPSDEKNPMILYENYKNTIEALQAEIDQLRGILKKAFDLAVGNLGSKIPSLIKAADEFEELDYNQNIVKNNLNKDLHSKKFFRENDINFNSTNVRLPKP